jgi:hypothetical protein
VGVEVKAAATWRREYGTALKALIAQRSLQGGYGVYLGTAELKDATLRILPLKRFLKDLASGHVLVTGPGG